MVSFIQIHLCFLLHRCALLNRLFEQFIAMNVSSRSESWVLPGKPAFTVNVKQDQKDFCGRQASYFKAGNIWQIDQSRWTSIRNSQCNNL